jgi:hypothetical protein
VVRSVESSMAERGREYELLISRVSFAMHGEFRPQLNLMAKHEEATRLDSWPMWVAQEHWVSSP